MNIKAYTIGVTTALFGSLVKTKGEAKRYVLNHSKLSLVDFVIYKNHKYTIQEVYKWRS